VAGASPALNLSVHWSGGEKFPGLSQNVRQVSALRKE
jgi:hypothetical protein